MVSHVFLEQLLTAYYEGKLKKILEKVRAEWSRIRMPKAEKTDRFHRGDRFAVESISIGPIENPRAFFERWMSAKMGGANIFQPGSVHNMYLAFEADSDLLPRDLNWALRNCDASLPLRMIGEECIAELLKADLDRLRSQFMKTLASAVIEPESYLAALLRERRLTQEGRLNYYSARDRRTVFENLQSEFCHLLTALAPRAMLENMSLLVSLGNPPYPVAVWQEAWIIQAFKKFARSHGKRWYTQARAISRASDSV